jgi:Phage tail sheath protein subtilisin-like domain/Phage tail sheath C-terminal domain
MPLNLASPGIVVREVDLTIGRVDPVSGSVGALVAPFAKGPVDLPQLIENENDLYQTFGQPYSTDKHYEHWMVASSYLNYGGTMRVLRANDSQLTNAFVGAAASVKIKSNDHYVQLGYDENTITNVTFAAKNPGTWANGIKVAVIDAKADQILTGVTTTNVQVGYGFTVDVPAGTSLPGTGSTSLLGGYFKGVITEVGTSKISTKLVSIVSAAGTETAIDYQQNGVYALPNTGTVAIHTNGQSTSFASRAYTGELDWFEQQSITLTVGSIEWDTIASRPSTSAFVAGRGGRFDEVHVAVIDDLGTITGNAGTILEKHLSLSKAKDGEFSVGSPSYWRKYLETNSQYVFGGSQPVGVVTTGFSVNGAAQFELNTDTGWDQDAQNVIFAGTGSNTYTLAGGKNYGGKTDLVTSGALYSGLDDIVSGLTIFENTEEYEVDFILMGSANYPKDQAQALANKCISVAEVRKDAVAFISPYRQAFLNDSSVGTVTVNNIDTITDNVVSFYSPITSTTYGVFDSGYKYMYDRFNDTFRYVPLNGDIAGTCARTDIQQFPWFSPAGTSRGAILNAVKLAYNPGRKQRDILYSNRINPVIFSPGAGIILFGDKTGFGKSSAFDRINVRRLFIYLEDAISAAAKDFLFEFNDEITRTSFVNIIEPFLRDVQSKRGIFDYVVICDETNNTAAVIDANEFVADIYIKPARSINFIGLTFIATRTGVAFEEVIGSV